MGLHRDFHESVVLLGDGDDAEAAVAVLVQSGTRVLHKYGPRLIIADIQPQARAELLSHCASTLIEEDATVLTSRSDLDLDEAAALGLQAFAYRQSAEFIEQTTSESPYGASPDGGVSLPVPAPAAPVRSERPAESSTLDARPFSERLIGTVAVGLVYVDGPTPDLKWTDVERANLRGMVQDQNTWLGQQGYHSWIAFEYYEHKVSIDAPPPPWKPVPPDPETWEKIWRNPTMQALKCSPNLWGVDEFAERQRQSAGTFWTYVAFFTKYPTVGLCYSEVPRIVYYNTARQSGEFARATAHLFGAPYESAASGCDCGGQFGYYKRANGNCETCAPGGGVDCVMRGNLQKLCAWTHWHLGFQYPKSLPINPAARTSLFPAVVGVDNVTTPEHSVPPSLYLFFKDGSNKLAYFTSPDGVTWANPRPIAEAGLPGSAPAAVLFKGELYVFFKDERFNTITYCVSSDGIKWSRREMAIKYATSVTPAPVSFNDTLYLFYSRYGNSHLTYTASSDGGKWSEPKEIEERATTWDPPSAVEYGGWLFVFCRSTEAPYKIFYHFSENGERWTARQSIPTEVDNTLTRPGAVVFNNDLYVFAVLPKSSEVAFYQEMLGQWNQGHLLWEDTTQAAVSAAVFNDNLNVFFTATTADKTIQQTVTTPIFTGN